MRKKNVEKKGDIEKQFLAVVDIDLFLEDLDRLERPNEDGLMSIQDPR